MGSAASAREPFPPAPRRRYAVTHQAAESVCMAWVPARAAGSPTSEN